MSIKKNILFLLLLFQHLYSIYGQEKMVLSLKDVIKIAQEESLDAFIAKNLYLVSYYDYKAYKAERRPWLEFDSDPFDYNNSFEKVTTTTGTSLVRNNSLATEGAISLSQIISSTGGEISAISSLERYQDYANNYLYYNSSPLSIELSQPLFQFNEYKWKKKLEPIIFEKAKLDYLEDAEDIALQAIEYYFDLLDAQLAFKIAETNKISADSLYIKSYGKYERGAFAYNDLQRLELNKINVSISFEEAKLSLERVNFELKSYLRLPIDSNIELELPVDVPNIKIVPEEALEQANINSVSPLDFKQTIIEADEDIAEAKGDFGISANLDVDFGLSKTGNSAKETYYGCDQDRGIQLSLYIPILDWGMSKEQYKLAKANKEIVAAQVELDRISFEQDVLMSVIEFNMKELLLESAQKADTLSENTYKIIEESFVLGKVDLETLYAARSERESALKSYYSTLRSYWQYFYYIRKITLYDFITNKSLSKDFDVKYDIE